MIKVIEEIPYGICPECRRRLMLLRSEYTAYILAESGWIQSKVDEKSDLKMVCPNCGFTRKARVGDSGLIPEGLDDMNLPRKPILKNLISDNKEEEE